MSLPETFSRFANNTLQNSCKLSSQKIAFNKLGLFCNNDLQLQFLKSLIHSRIIHIWTVDIPINRQVEETSTRAQANSLTTLHAKTY